MPAFPSVADDQAVMIGRHADEVILDAYAKEYRDFDVEAAYAGMRKNATEATMLPWSRGPLTHDYNSSDLSFGWPFTSAGTNLSYVFISFYNALYARIFLAPEPSGYLAENRGAKGLFVCVLEIARKKSERQMKFGEKTLREIHNQPEVWQSCLDALDRCDLDLLIGDRDPRSNKWIFLGCGTSYYLAEAAAASFMTLTGQAARAVPASEFLLFPKLVIAPENASVFPVLISRSGQTTEVLRAAEILERSGIEFLSVTCDGSELAQLTHRPLKLPVVEQSTVMTSSFTSMLISLQFVAAYISGQNDFIDALRTLPPALDRLLPLYAPQVQEFAVNAFDGAAFLGQGALYPIAQETALKVMESSSSYAHFFHTLEFRHGPKSIVSEKVLVGALLSETGYAEESAVLLEMKELGGRTLAIGNCISRQVRSAADLVIELGLNVPELARLAVYVVWGQLLGSYMGIRKGLNPDSPRNLSRIVTLVE